MDIGSRKYVYSFNMNSPRIFMVNEPDTREMYVVGVIFKIRLIYKYLWIYYAI